MNNQQITLYLLRHGEIENSNVLAGQTDVSLSTLGQQQMIEAMNALDFKRCISSPLSRCQLVAKSWCEQQAVYFEVEDRIQECYFGDWDGQSFDSLWSMPTPNIGDFWQSPEKITPPNGETYQQFSHRIEVWWREFLAKLSAEHDKTLVVAHAGVIKLILANILEVENSSELLHRIRVNYASPIKLYVFIEGEKRWASLLL